MRMRNLMLTIPAALAVTFVVSQARAQDIGAMPYGPGTADRPQSTGRRIVPGPEAAGFMGGAFGVYGFGLGGRVGYTFSPGIYAGAQTTYYFGRELRGAVGSEQSSAFLVGGELGYKVYPMERWELRPYVFLGPSVMRDLNEFGRMETKTRFVFYPALAASYRFGKAFVGAEARMHLPPDPTAIGVMAGGGLSF
jgi:hypothetical protein